MPDAQAQYGDCGVTSNNAHDYEIGFKIIQGNRVVIRAIDAWTNTEYDWWETDPNTFVTLPNGSSLGCNWVAHTTGTGPGYIGPVAVLPSNHLWWFEFIGYQPDGTTVIDTLRYSNYYNGSVNAGETFYGPYTHVGTPDYFFHYVGGPGSGSSSAPSTIVVKPVEIFPLSVDSVLGSDWVLPYDNPGGDPGNYPFLTKGHGFTYRFADRDVVPPPGTAHTWEPPEPVTLLLKPTRKLRVAGSLTAGDVTVGPATPAQGWGGLDLQSGGALRVSGRFTVRAADHTLRESVVVEPEGVLTADGGTWAFAPNERLLVEGRLSAIGEENDPVTFTEADPGDGWLGIRFRAGTESALPNELYRCVIEKAGLPAPSTERRPLEAAVEVYDRTLVIGDGTEVRGSDDNFYGLHAAGAAHVRVTGGSQIYENDGGGVYAALGAYVEVKGGSEVRDNPGGGVGAAGYGTTLLLDGVTIRDHDGPGSAEAPGVWAGSNGQVLFANDASDTRVQVLNNDGGLNTSTGGSLDAGECPGGTLPCPGRNQHLISGNSQGGAFFDARSVSGSTLYAEGNDWNVTDVSQLGLDCDGASVLRVCPLVGGTCVEPQCSGSAGRKGAGRGGALRGIEDVLALVDEAERARLAGDMAAFGIAADAVVAALASEGEDERRAAFEGATRLFAWEQPAGPLGSLASLAGQPGEGRPWALRVLGVARASGEDYALARVAADTLASAYSGSEHARFGLGLAVRAAVAEGDEAGAVAALLALVSVFPEADEVGALAALVLGAFPEADLSGLEGGFAPRTAAAATTSLAPGALLSVGGARPNPVSSQASVPFSLAEAADVEAVLYDVLGRRVATLASGRYAAGAHALALDGASLPPGVYVVYVRAHGAAGAAAAVRRVTLAR